MCLPFKCAAAVLAAASNEYQYANQILSKCDILNMKERKETE
jgi:hypothetical protein